MLASSGYSQGKEARKEANKARPKYIELGGGVSISSYRDFATSPIFYTGAVGSFSAHYHRFDTTKETRYGFRFMGGNYGFAVGNETASSSVSSLYLDFGKLYQLPQLSNDKYSIKVGGLFMLNGNLRSDPALQNTSFGYEIIYNLMASAKVSRDVSRKETKSGKVLFVKYNWKPRRRLLSYRLNVGVMNANYRNGYSYISQNSVINEQPLFADYENSLFQGFRMSSALRYTIFLDSGHALRFGYIWDAYTTGEEEAKLEMANHLFNVAVLFKL